MTIIAAATADERLAAWAAAEIVDGEAVFVGIGIPSQAAILAKSTHAPRSILIYESGVIDAMPVALPRSTGGPEVARGAAMIADSLTVFAELQAGRIDVGLLSGAQVDVTGALNSTRIGPAERPRLHLPGSGGAHDIALLARRVVIVMPHDPRRFVAAVDFATSPGTTARRTAAGAAGPVRLVTGSARFGFGSDGRLRLDAVAAGLDPRAIVDELGLDIAMRNPVGELPEPGPETLAILRRLTAVPGHG